MFSSVSARGGLKGLGEVGGEMCDGDGDGGDDDGHRHHLAHHSSHVSGHDMSAFPYSVL